MKPTVDEAARVQSFGAQLSALLGAMPDRNSSDLERADWCDAKADLLERVGSAEAVELAGTARATAVRLRGPGVA
ncbi:MULTISPECIES: hypothetical protein [Catenuloplanes]|uniref:Uncharacterized protein n=1 Tax=Catenuloplanes niger TaxID=587534 RepID=A0AAE4CW53_9ACTN|nr:hypothetical protein [Catenuloplanes niger]MDR7323459.1 hypothetical protein [Catenuloplanes niger]